MHSKIRMIGEGLTSVIEDGFGDRYDGSGVIDACRGNSDDGRSASDDGWGESDDGSNDSDDGRGDSDGGWGDSDYVWGDSDVGRGDSDDVTCYSHVGSCARDTVIGNLQHFLCISVCVMFASLALRIFCDFCIPSFVLHTFALRYPC